MTSVTDPLGGRDFHVHLGDCIPHLHELPPAWADCTIQSPPFPSLYAYSSSEADIGNSEGLADMRMHLSYWYRALARALKPGRVAIVHVCQIPRMKRAGGQGLFDFRGLNIRLGERAGLVYCYDWMVRQNPQSQAVRTRSRELQFAGLESDRANSRGTLCDYLLKFVAKGENAVAVDSKGEVSRDNWIEWAEGCWRDLRMTDNLNVKGTKDTDDTKHICPLALPVIERCVRMFSNPGEVVLSCFAGIGSEMYSALKLGRRAYGAELKDTYHAAAVKNCERALRERSENSRTLFDGLDDGCTAGPTNEDAGAA